MEWRFYRLDMDEYAYAAYLKSLIDNHPRRNDPLYNIR